VKEHSKLFPVKFFNFLQLLVTNVDTAILIQNNQKKSKPKMGAPPPIFKNESLFQILKWLLCTSISKPYVITFDVIPLNSLLILEAK
jgi:hypothetical protein